MTPYTEGTLVKLKTLLPAGVVVLATAGAAHHASAASTSVKASVSKGVLTVAGTKNADSIVVRLRAGNSNVVEIDVGANGSADFSFDRSRFTVINVNGNDGDDTLVADPINGTFTDTEATTLDGGAGNDTLRGANGTEQLLGGAGTDSIDGNQGTDVVNGGAGADTINWDPGDGSDTVVGGDGVDTLTFNGANIGEAFDFSGAGTHVRLTRNIAGIVMDLAEVETVDLRTLGGADVLTVNDLTGTGLTRIDTDLAAFGGVDDLSADSVDVAAGVTVGSDGIAAVVDGLGARVRVLNGFAGDQIHVTGSVPTDVVHVAGTAGADVVSAIADGTDVAVDGATPGVLVRLSGVGLVDVNLAGGDDQFSAIGDVNSLTRLDVDGGAGNDTLRGGNGPDVISGGADTDFVDGNQGSDVLDGGDGSDTIAWDPGDGSDTVVGGAGVDTLAFNGANIGELFDVSANGTHVRFTRNIGTVTLDVDQIEGIALRTLGGADVLTVNDLTGTGLTRIDTDLSATVGGPDLTGDSVIVNGTSGDDVINVADDGGAVVVQGLAVTVRVSGADPTLDTLTVNGLDGADAITSTAVAQSLMVLQLVP